MKTIKLIIFCLFVCLFASAADQDSIYIKGKVLDKLTHVQLPGSLVEILNAKDSSVVNSKEAYVSVVNGNEQKEEAEYEINVPRKAGKYILRVTKSGYDTAFLDLIIDKIQNRAYKIDVSPIYLAPLKSVNLADVEVKATRVKFYHKGDTLVYNADAFQLAEGSMLDALIRQLPGAELRKNGQIYVNGKFVENLLLNGKDFFKGDNTVMLENLPNYMVSSINVYDKLGENSKFTGHEMAGDKQFVMDVKLKKQYSVGWMGNVEAGEGTKERYLARLFAMRFTDHSRVAIYGNLNNLNDSREPGEDDNWTPSDLTGGLIEQQFGGVDYYVEERDGKYQLNGNAQVKHSGTNSDIHTNRTNFLAGGDTYDRMLNSNRNHEFSVNTEHRFYFEGKKANLELLPMLSYRKNDNTTNYSSLTLTKDFSNYGKTQLDSLFSKKLGTEFLKNALNRNIQEGKLKGHSLETGMSASSTLKFKNSPDNLTFFVSGNYKDEKEERFDHNLVEYYTKGTSGVTSDYRNRYFDNQPERSYHLTGKVTYTYVSGKWYTLFLSYKYDRKFKSSHSSLFRLEQLDGWGENSQYGLGVLPSTAAYLNTIDALNSYRSRQYEDKHTVEPFLNWQVKTKGGKWSGQFVLPVSYQTNTMHYQRGDVDTTFTKHHVLLNIYSTYAQWASKDKTKNFKLSYELTSKVPDMNRYVTIHDTTDPLNITLGNPDLTSTYHHQVVSSYTKMLPEKQMLLGIEGVYKVTTNEVAMGYTYDKATGVRTFKPDNVNGNWEGNLTLALFTPINKKKNLMLRFMAGPTYNHSVDLIGLAGAPTSRSIVKTAGIYEQIELGWKIGKQNSITFKSNGNWGHTSSSRQDFQSFSATDLSNGLIAQFQLPWKLQLGTDMTLYTRRGYANKEMNTDDFVWNARLSRPFFKGKLLAIVDGFDMLGQLSNVTRVMNAQAITETYSNVIPRYVMFHLVYRFQKSAK